MDKPLKKKKIRPVDSDTAEENPLDNLMNATANAVSAVENEPDEDEDTEIDTEGQPEESEPNDDGITIVVPEKKTAPKATTVPVATIADHDCYIGGKLYHFKKGEKTMVPAPVKDILKRAGLLVAL